MLNEQLFRKLQKLFKNVDVIQAGVPAQIEERSGLALNGWKISPGGSGLQYRVGCPFCGDAKKHLYISHVSYANVSLNGVSMGKSGLLAKCFRRDCLADPVKRAQLDLIIQSTVVDTNVDIRLAVVLDNSLFKPKYDVKNTPTLLGIRSWYKDYTPIDLHCLNELVLSYLLDRGVSLLTAKKFKLGYGVAHSATTGTAYLNGAPFIMLPVILPAALKGVQLRALPQYITGDFPKYLFHSACKRNLMLYNRLQAAKFRVCVITEGAFDALKVGPPAIATFGHTPSKIQLRHIEVDHQLGGVIWLPDNDIKKSASGKVLLDPPAIARLQCAKWNKQGAFAWGAHVVTLPAKDAGLMSTIDIWAAILLQVHNPLMLDYILQFIIPELDV